MRLRPLNPKVVPPAFLDCARVLRERGHRAYFVGGCVRDLLRGVSVADWDSAASARPKELLAIFPTAVPARLKHGTVTVPTSAGNCEITTFSVESGSTD